MPINEATGLSGDMGVTEEMIRTYGDAVWELSLNVQIRRGDPIRALDFEALVPDPHGLLAHADRFGGYALVRPSVDPAFRAALESLIDPRLSPGDRLSGIVKAVREAMSPAEFIRLFSPSLHN